MIAQTNKTDFPFVFLSATFILSLLAAGLTNQPIVVLVPFVALLFYAGWFQVNIVFILLLLSLPFSFEYNFTPSLGTDIPDEGLMLLVSVLFFGYWLYKPESICKNVWQHPLLLLLLVHIAWIVIASTGSTHPLLSLKFILAKGWYLGAFVLAALIAFRDKQTIRLAAIILAASILLIAAIALVRHSITGFSFADVNKSVAPFFRNHVNYSSMLVCLIPLFFSFYSLNKKKSVRPWVVIAIVVLLAALFFSYARGAWLALILGVLSYWLVHKKIFFASFVVTVFIAIFSLFWLKNNDRYLYYAHDFKTTIYHEDFKQHLVATYQLKDVSTAERFYRWVAGVRMIKDNSFTGYGPGTFYENYKPYGVPAFKTWVSDNKEHSTVHNYFLLTAIEQGIPGLTFFLVLLGAMFYYSQRLYHRITDAFYKTAAVTIAVMLVMITTVNFLSDLIETDKVGSLFFLCLSVLVMIDINTRKELQPSSNI